MWNLKSEACLQRHYQQDKGQITTRKHASLTESVQNMTEIYALKMYRMYGNMQYEIWYSVIV